jgi:hypothetical protein
MSSEKEMTPEEKLLALIQQDKRPDASPAAERPAGVAATPVTAPAIAVQPPPPAAPPAPAAVSSGVAPVPVAKHDAPSPAKAAVPARPDAVGERTPALSSPAPNAAADAGPKLKLAASSAPSLSKSQTGTRSTPASTEESSAVAAHGGRGAAGPALPSAREPSLPGAAAIEKTAAPVPVQVARPAPAAPAPKAVRASAGALMRWPIINRALSLVVLVLLVIVVYSVASVRSDIDKAMVRQLNQAGSVPVHPVGIEAVIPPPVDVYLGKVSGRDLFRLAEVEKGALSNAPPAEAEFRLVGVSLDARDAKGSMAILRSKSSSQTFFVKVGEALGSTGFTLDRVLADRAILKKQKQEIEVR